MSDYTVKCCTKCGQELPATIEYFNAAKFGKYGVSARCKKCDRAYYESRKSELIERSRKHYWNNRDEIRRKRNAKYIPHPREIITTPERVKAQKKRYRDTHKEKCSAATAKSKQLNPAARAAEKQRRRAAERELPNGFSQHDWKRALDYFGGGCAICGRPRGFWHTLAADHWIPLSSPNCPGTIPTNIIPLCHGIDGCNNAKATRDPIEWLIDRFGPRRAKQIAKRIEDYFATLEKH